MFFREIGGGLFSTHDGACTDCCVSEAKRRAKNSSLCAAQDFVSSPPCRCWAFKAFFGPRSRHFDRRGNDKS